MPIYEYQCNNCHHAFDLMQKMSDTPISLCPECGENTAVRLVSAAGFQLKGTGWYVTDFKNKGKPAAASENGDKKATTESKAASTDSKGETN